MASHSGGLEVLAAAAMILAARHLNRPVALPPRFTAEAAAPGRPSRAQLERELAEARAALTAGGQQLHIHVASAEEAARILAVTRKEDQQ